MNTKVAFIASLLSYGFNLNSTPFNPEDLILIDGGHGEAGGQMLRLVLMLAVLVGRPLLITNIRKGRKTAGLRNSHLKCVWSAIRAGITVLTPYGEPEVGTTDLLVLPCDRASLVPVTTLHLDIAGSVTLMMQFYLPLMLVTPGTFSTSFRGGTEVGHAPLAFFWTRVLSRFLPYFAFNQERASFGSKGVGVGEVIVRKADGALNPFTIGAEGDRGPLTRLSVFIRLQGQGVDEEYCKVVSEKVQATFPGIPVEIVRVDDKVEAGSTSGLSVLFVADFANGGFVTSSFYVDAGKGFAKRFAKAMEGSSKLEEISGITGLHKLVTGYTTSVCVYALDQLLVYAAQAKGTSVFYLGNTPLTQHTKTALWVLKQTLGTQGFSSSYHKESGVLTVTGIN